MAQLTKTQINYFRERLGAVSGKIIAAMKEEAPMMLPELNVWEERIKAIASGAVELDMDAVRKLTPPDVYSDGPSLFRVFPDPTHVCEYLTTKSRLSEFISLKKWENTKGLWVDAVHAHMQLLLDDFVLGNIQSEDVPQLLKDLESWRPSGYWPIIRKATETNDNINE